MESEHKQWVWSFGFSTIFLIVLCFTSKGCQESEYVRDKIAIEHGCQIFSQNVVCINQTK